MSLGALAALTGCQPPPETVPPAWCRAEGELSARCDAAHCVAAVVIDYVRLEPRGYRVFALEGEAIQSEEEATRLAVDHVVGLGAPVPDQADAERNGDFYHSTLKNTGSSNEWVVLVHHASSQVLFAEPQLWGDPELRGFDFPLPDGFSTAAPLGCTDGAGEPEKVNAVTTGAPLSGDPPSTAKEAWEVARRLNLTEQITAQKSYRAFVITYAPAIGEFDAKSADWYVWITPTQ